MRNKTKTQETKTTSFWKEAKTTLDTPDANVGFYIAYKLHAFVFNITFFSKFNHDEQSIWDIEKANIPHI
jgi:hypothetical protein